MSRGSRRGWASVGYVNDRMLSYDCRRKHTGCTGRFVKQIGDGIEMDCACPCHTREPWVIEFIPLRKKGDPRPDAWVLFEDEGTTHTLATASAVLEQERSSDSAHRIQMTYRVRHRYTNQIVML